MSLITDTIIAAAVIRIAFLARIIVFFELDACVAVSRSPNASGAWSTEALPGVVLVEINQPCSMIVVERFNTNAPYSPRSSYSSRSSIVVIEHVKRSPRAVADQTRPEHINPHVDRAPRSSTSHAVRAVHLPPA